MSVFKTYLKNATTESLPGDIQGLEISSLAPPKPRIGSRTHSTYSYQAASLRNEDEIKNMKTEVMVEWLYKQQRLKLWASAAPEEGVVIKKGRGDYTCCPEELRYVKGGLFEQIVNMNVRVSINYVCFSSEADCGSVP